MTEIGEFYNIFHANENHLLNRIMEDMRYEYLQKEVAKYPGKILVIGCGSKREMTIVSSRHSEVWGIDISQTAIEKTKKRFPKYNLEVMDACNMSFAENYFDIIVCSEVIEHLPNQSMFLNDVSRILNEGGVFILTTPNWWSWYGLARVIAEKLTGKPCTSDDQPIDNWATPGKLIRKLRERRFSIKKLRGLWYLPPFGKGKYRLPGLVTYPVYIVFYPFEKLFSVTLPRIGHMIAITMTKSSPAR